MRVSTFIVTAVVGCVWNAALLVQAAGTTRRGSLGEQGFNPTYTGALINLYRVRKGTMPLRLSNRLNAFAQALANDHANNPNPIAKGHVDSNGRDFGARLDAAGLSRKTAENVFPGSTVGHSSMVRYPSTEVEALVVFLKSEPHRNNILRRGVTAFGFGYAKGANGIPFFVQVFKFLARRPGEPKIVPNYKDPAILAAWQTTQLFLPPPPPKGELMDMSELMKPINFLNRKGVKPLEFSKYLSDEAKDFVPLVAQNGGPDPTDLAAKCEEIKQESGFGEVKIVVSKLVVMTGKVGASAAIALRRDPGDIAVVSDPKYDYIGSAYALDGKGGAFVVHILGDAPGPVAPTVTSRSRSASPSRKV